MSAATTRTFVAVFPPAEVVATVGEALAALRASTAGMKWVRASNLHYTLRFLGPLLPPRVEAARCAVVAVAAATSPFRIRLGGPGAFPGLKRPRILWLGAAEGAAALASLAGGVEQALARQGFVHAERPFTPHLTVARVGEFLPHAQPLIATFLASRALDLDFEVREVELMASTLAAGGSRYEALERAPLAGVP